MFDTQETEALPTTPLDPTLDAELDAYVARLDAEVAAGNRREPDADLLAIGHEAADVPEMVLAGQPVEELDADGCLDLLRLAQRRRSGWDALVIRLLARIAALRPSPDHEHPASTNVGDEVAAELDQSPITMTRQIAEAQTLVRRLPAAVDALENGDIDLTRAKALAQLTDPLTDTQATQATAAILDKGRRASPAHFRRALRRVIHKLDPDAAERRRATARTTRDVRIDTRHDDGMAALTSTLPAADALRAYQRLDHLARYGLPPDDPRTLAQRRADVFLDLLLDRRPHPHVDTAVNVTVAASTLAGIDDQPATLHGYGTITASYARELAEHATWRRILTEKPGGTTLEVSRRRYPSPALARHIRARNQRCVFPACSQPAEGCDLDHTRPYADNGLTSEANLGPLCRRHHRMKDRPGSRWTLAQPRPGEYLWTSPTGRIYTTTPTSWDQD